ncbi:hypothetical protein FOYG_02948 [Fusarium oxysporum NRRL 32931]|uniref:Uncharacterized protein n=1 Tax=Fusarium oxysporum NRRL 32931 TaxID=660029 RepID=W9IUW9_FUSOX|nr:hypothetical protein FOYG_02948 [Fusarium oxysporum NRRL 32931]
MTVGELRQKISLSKFHQARGPFASVRVIQRLQPGREEDRMIGLTCHAIADLIRKYINATPAIALRKANDDEISQSGIDELLDDDEEIWEDFSDDEPLEDILDDESAGDLFMRFEEKHTLDNSVDGSN